MLIADGEPGTFDEHSRRLERPRLAGHFTRFDALAYHQQRLTGNEGETKRAMRALLEKAGVRPEFAVVDESNQPVTGVETHTFRNGDVFIVGLLSNPQLRVDELGPPEFRSNAAFEKPRDVRLRLPAALEAYDLRTGRQLGRKTELALHLDPYEPALIAFSPRRLPGIHVAAPARVPRGAIGRIGIRFEQASPAETHVFHVGVVDPSGKPMFHYSGNLRAVGGSIEKLLPLARNDAAGRWTVRVRDILSGQEWAVGIEVHWPGQH